MLFLSHMKSATITILIGSIDTYSVVFWKSCSRFRSFPAYDRILWIIAFTVVMRSTDRRWHESKISARPWPLDDIAPAILHTNTKPAAPRRRQQLLPTVGRHRTTSSPTANNLNRKRFNKITCFWYNL